MVLNMCNDYRFTQGRFISIESGKEYVFRIGKRDRFYDDMKKYISNGKVEELTKVMIDELFVTDRHAEFIKEKTFILRAIVLVDIKDEESGEIIVFSYNVEINNISILDMKSYDLDDDTIRVAKMCTLQIPYNTEIEISEIKDYKKEEE